MSEVKLQIIGSILKLNRPFRIPHIMQVTGIDRNLTRYHISALTQQGMLEKIDKSYVMRDREALLSSLLEESEKSHVAKMKSKGFVGDATVFKQNLYAETVIAGKVLGLPCMEDVKTAYLRKIDETINEFKNLRKYLTTASKTDGSAAKFFKKMDMDNREFVWQGMAYIGEDLFTPSWEEFKDAIAIGIEDAEDE
jgi:hypothetical protein